MFRLAGVFRFRRRDRLAGLPIRRCHPGADGDPPEDRARGRCDMRFP